VILNTFAGPKVIFTGMEDPEAHLTAFHTQMVLVGGSDAARCKLFMSTFTGMAMDWFISLRNGHITSFRQLSQLFREQYLANKAPSQVSYDLFDVKQYQGETLKKYINRFGAQVVKVGTSEEPMSVSTLFGNLLFAIAQGPLVKYGVGGGTYRLRRRGVREANQRRALTPEGADAGSARQGQRDHDGEEEPSPGVQQEAIARQERGQGRRDTTLWWS